MPGPTITMTMTSLFSNTTNVFSRSRSSPNIPDLARVEPKKQYPADSKELPRAASYTSIPVPDPASYDETNDSKSVFSTGGIVDNGPGQGTDKQTNEKAVQNERPKIERVGRRKSLVARPRSWMQKARNGISPERKPISEIKNPIAIPPVPLLKKPSQEKLRAGSFASFARKPWISSSRSSSPNRPQLQIDDENITPASSISSSSPQKPSIVVPARSENTLRNSVLSTSSLPTAAKKGNVLSKSNRRKSDLITGGDLKDLKSFRSANSSAGSLPNGSVEALSYSASSSSDIPPLPKKLSADRLATLGTDSPKRKDELWSAFRSLDADFAKFQSKSSALRTNVVRSTLLPFLRTHAHHPSNKRLRPEDIDRRVNVLNRWWTGLLEMLDGQNNHYVSGIDRPVILEAITAIMIRPEWRPAPSCFASLPERLSEQKQVPRSISSTSLSSAASFLSDSIYHNIRNMFVQNLLSQMSMVVDKMSLRTAPASLVTFCGKAAAFAFFFCPGVAEILLKLWNISPNVIRRMADELGLVPRSPKASATDEIVTEFPPHLHALGWKSAKAVAAQMRQRTSLPLGAAKISWYGPWTARWCGRDSDLFFVFCKHYHILLEDFLPSDAPFADKARAPGFLMVQCQILTALDATIHRQPSGDAATGPGTVTFDDVLLGIDASASALPLPPSSNAARLMAENRLIMLLRELLSENPAEFERSRHTFAATFSHVMQASARMTSQFDHNACFILCDFIEEALPIYLRFQNAQKDHVDYIGWPFWLTVCRKILQSENSLSQIRVFSFIHGAWNLISNDGQRKTVLCLDWLLSEDEFRKYFLHWCPMVRAYYMRLLCWRACRYDGEASHLDTKILSTVSDRLKLVWSHYLYLKQLAERANTLLPSTTPCHPAPGRRLMIIRNDTQAAAANLMLGFDGIYPRAGGTQAEKRRSSMLNLHATDFTDSSDHSRKKWSLLGKMMPFNGNVVAPSSSTGPGHVNSLSPSEPKTSTLKSPLEIARSTTVSTKSTSSRPSLLRTQHSSSSSTSLDDPEPPLPTHRAFSFKFSLEWSTMPQIHPAFHMDERSELRRNLGLGDQGWGRERRLSPPRLPAPAHSWLVSQVPGTANEVWARAPDKCAEVEAKYAGRALAEWVLIVSECNNFVERRRAEGVPNLKLMEVPTLGVEGFKKFN